MFLYKMNSYTVCATQERGDAGACVRVTRKCMRVRGGVRECVSVGAPGCAGACGRVHVHVCVRECGWALVWAWVRASGQAGVCASVPGRVIYAVCSEVGRWAGWHGGKWRAVWGSSGALWGQRSREGRARGCGAGLGGPSASRQASAKESQGVRG